MFARIFKKTRYKKVLLGLAGLFITLIAFQNCAPPNENSLCAGEKCPKAAANTPASGTSNSASTGNSTGNSASPNGYINGGVTSINDGSGSTSGGSIGGSSGGSSNGGSGGTTPAPSTNNNLRILSQPGSNVTVAFGGNIQLTVDVAGGTTPYVYQWYKDNQPLSTLVGSSYFLADVANRYSKEGTYYLKIKDTAGTTIQTSNIFVGVTESTGPCDAAQYMMFNAPSKDTGLDLLSLFENPHGKYLVNKSNTDVSFMNANASYWGLSYFNFTPALQDGQTASVSCKTSIPRIHTPLRNPGSNSNTYEDSATYKYQGAVTFACHNQKYKFVSDTCTWVRTNAPANGGGTKSGSGNSNSNINYGTPGNNH